MDTQFDLALGVIVSTVAAAAILYSRWGWSGRLAGVGLASWIAWHEGRRSFFVAWLMMAATLPFLTVVSQGFLGYGVGALVAVVAFVVTFTRPKPRWLLIAVILMYLGLSFYVTYMR